MLVGVVTELPIEGIEERAQICHELGSFLHGLPRRGNQIGTDRRWPVGFLDVLVASEP